MGTHSQKPRFKTPKGLLWTLALVLVATLAPTTLVHPQPVEQLPGVFIGRSDEGVGYLMGGVGSGERETMEALDADYNLKLIFALLSGDYVAGVNVTLSDQHGKIIASTMCNGPWLYLKVLPGTYDVSADFAGTGRTIKSLRLSKGQRIVRFIHWDFDRS